MVVAGCLVEKQLKKSKDSSLPIEMSGTLPMSFTDKSELLTSANNMEMTETDTVGKKVKKKKKKTLLTLRDGASPLFLSTDNTETTAAGTNGKTFKKKKNLLTFGDGMSPQSFTVRPEVFSETAEMDITKKGVKKKKKKTHVQTSKLMFGDDPAPLVTDAFKGQKEQTSGQKTKKRKLNKEIPEQDDAEEDLPEQVLEVLNESELEKVKKKKKKHRQESENQEPTAEVSELSEPETKKRKKKHKDSRSTVMVLPTEHLTETSLDGNPVTVEHDTETSGLEASTAVGGRQKAKKKRAKQHLHPPEPAATPVLGQIEGQKNKRRTEQLLDSPKLGEAEMEGQKKKRKKRRAEQLPDCPAPAATPVLREVEMEKQKKKKKKKHRQENESQEPTAEVSELSEPEPKKKKKHKDSRSTVMVLPTEHLTETSLDGNPVTVEHDTETSGLEASTAVGGRQKAKKKRAKQHLHPSKPTATPVLGQMEGQKERKKKKKRTEQLLDSPVLGEMEGEKKRKRTEKIPDCLVLGQVAMTGQKKKKRRTEQLTGSAMLGEVELKGQKKRKKKQLPDSQAKVLGATAKERQKKKKKKKRQNGENVVMEVETPKSKKKKCDGGTQVADERMSERQTDAVENYVEELEEFVPDVRSKSLRQIYKLIKYDLGRFRAFKSQGIPLRSGRFSEEENKRLTKNVSDFLALSGIKHANQAFHPQRFKDLYMHLKRLRSQYKFHERLAEGIPRPWHVVYQRGRRMFDENNHKGRFSEEELHQLKKFQTLHGNDWKKISLVMGRSDLSLEKRFSQLASNKGVWSVEETRRLMDAMREHLQGLTEPAGENQMNGEVIRKEKLYKDLPWTDVSYNVQTRSWTQCKNKWMSLLKEKMAPGHQAASINRGIKCKSTQAKINLIERMYEMQVEDAADIDWDKVTESMGNVPPYYIQKQFNRLKVSKVPLWEQLTYCDIIDFLYKVVLPEFREYLTKAPLTENSLEQMPDPKEYFLLSDIFSEECEVDNVN